MKFQELDLPPYLLKSVENMGFTEATSIQEKVLPVARKGGDVIGQAQTGTGKTAAFGLPMIEKVDPEDPNVQGLILTPTRELAVQVSEEINKIGRTKNVRAVAVYGGADMGRQIRELKSRPPIIVATPGRYMDHTRRKTIRPQSIRTVVLDEADEMLSMGFIEDIEVILEEVPNERQTLLFSATMPSRLKKVADRFMTEPETVSVKAKAMTVANIEQFAVKVPEKQKLSALSRFLDLEDPELAIIFGRTKRRVDELSEALEQQGYAAAGIHGDLKQAQRTKVLRRFKQGAIKYLVATDVAARGIDVSGVTHVFNFDLPQESDSYVHRIGRTGRAGHSGKSYTFVAPAEMDHMNMIEKATKGKINFLDVPNRHQAEMVQQERSAGKLTDIISKGGHEGFESTAEKLLQEHDSTTVVAAALTLLQKDKKEPTKTLTGERPIVSNKKGKPSSKHSNNRRGRGGGRNQGRKQGSPNQRNRRRRSS
ncbi:ATP-dependent RNA helicase DeaD [Geomicrobium halophilum]|uniref:ATP-dependent RNA helicase CshA n=1 Tax=Geomicrobium halophilum TaxID=549000 RepID=A0A841PPQ3_9BACL|nr:DEAD/DEAH box helicase [Geomicrobium halophilum]MBB6450750.1 ATP-dependent RNA helicase DeaD [Geomicrobium halophilum]